MRERKTMDNLVSLKARRAALRQELASIPGQVAAFELQRGDALLDGAPKRDLEKSAVELRTLRERADDLRLMLDALERRIVAAAEQAYDEHRGSLQAEVAAAQVDYDKKKSDALIVAESFRTGGKVAVSVLNGAGEFATRAGERLANATAALNRFNAKSRAERVRALCSDAPLGWDQ
jgi:hypothetical protein